MKDLLFRCDAREKQVLRFAQDDPAYRAGLGGQRTFHILLTQPAYRVVTVPDRSA